MAGGEQRSRSTRTQGPSFMGERRCWQTNNLSNYTGLPRFTNSGLEPTFLAKHNTFRCSSGWPFWRACAISRPGLLWRVLPTSTTPSIPKAYRSVPPSRQERRSPPHFTGKLWSRGKRERAHHEQKSLEAPYYAGVLVIGISYSRFVLGYHGLPAWVRTLPAHHLDWAVCDRHLLMANACLA